MLQKILTMHPKSRSHLNQKGILSIFFFFYATQLLNAQNEEIAPLLYNPDLLSGHGSSFEKSKSKTFDSTFIYVTDTLNLPLLDEFSNNHFQKYSLDFNAPNVTSDKKYRMLEINTNLPIPNQLRFAGQVTFKRTFNVETATYVDTPFTPTIYNVGSLDTYPVSYVPTPLYPPYYIYDTIGISDESDTVWIADPGFYQDSATQFFMTISDPNAFWLDVKAYHNYRFAFNPRTLGVVTFDGLDENGFPYNIGSTAKGWADVLTSKPIDLSPYSINDSIYFSFLYQAGGLGDVPELGDSLVLEFFAVNQNQWKRVWGITGNGTNTFKAVHLPITEPNYFKKGFQFRFRNYGGLSGSLDHFHVDYVSLKKLSGYQDTLFKDFAFSYPLGSLLKEFTSVPWDHFKNNPQGKMNDKVAITVHNGSNLSENNQNGTIQVLYNGVVEGTFSLNAQILSGGNINYAPRTTYVSYHDLSGGYIFDTTKLNPYQEFQLRSNVSAQFPNFPFNDSTSGVQVFSNYYSYDDGTAEAAYGPTGKQARLAIKFNAYEADSLIGLKIHFVPSVNDVSGKLFLLSVWDDDNGRPGNLLYEDDVFIPRSPSYEKTRNGFKTFYFNDTMRVPVSTSFFVGWRQLDSDRLNVGLDRNLDNSDKTFYSVDNGNSWHKSAIKGSVMIRPVFSTELDKQLGLGLKNQEKKIGVYPNPTEDQLHINIPLEEFKGATLYGLTGTLIRTIDENQFTIADLTPGIYLLRINGSNQLIRICRKP
jgi:hypothetical protein